MFNLRPTPRIEFTCAPEDLGVIAPPVPAGESLPDWFKRIPAVDREHVGVNDHALTVKRCMPFLDAMRTGWILPLAATVRLEIAEQGQRVDAGWDFDRTMVSFHHAYQVNGHPAQPCPPCKFHNHWSIRTPAGWSCLFVPLLNRANPVFEVAAGVVDTDSYTALINLPFFATGADGLHTIEKGTPLVQVIPFRRTDAAIESVVRAETAAEAAERTRIQRATSASQGWYRQEVRARR
jgi:hypothetical protein